MSARSVTPASGKEDCLFLYIGYCLLIMCIVQLSVRQSLQCLQAQEERTHADAFCSANVLASSILQLLAALPPPCWLIPRAGAARWAQQGQMHKPTAGAPFWAGRQQGWRSHLLSFADHFAINLQTPLNWSDGTNMHSSQEQSFSVLNALISMQVSGIWACLAPWRSRYWLPSSQ